MICGKVLGEFCRTLKFNGTVNNLIINTLIILSYLLIVFYISGLLTMSLVIPMLLGLAIFLWGLSVA